MNNICFIHFIVSDHKFYLAKIDMQQIDVLDTFGGIKHVELKDYFNANITSIINNDVILSNVAVIELDI